MLARYGIEIGARVGAGAGRGFDKSGADRMSGALIAACLWVLAATLVALLPMRWQFAPGLVLLVAAPGVIVWIGIAHGALVAVLGMAAFVSMFRNPLRYLWRRARGDAARLPLRARRE